MIQRITLNPEKIPVYDIKPYTVYTDKYYEYLSIENNTPYTLLVSFGSGNPLTVNIGSGFFANYDLSVNGFSSLSMPIFSNVFTFFLFTAEPSQVNILDYLKVKILLSDKYDVISHYSRYDYSLIPIQSRITIIQISKSSSGSPSSYLGVMETFNGLCYYRITNIFISGNFNSDLVRLEFNTLDGYNRRIFTIRGVQAKNIKLDNIFIDYNSLTNENLSILVYNTSGSTYNANVYINYDIFVH